jgi:hypothetical protein
MIDDTATTIANHTPAPDENKAPDSPRYNSYRAYIHERDNNHNLEDQRKILCAIIFADDGGELMKNLTAANFNYRSYDDYAAHKGNMELLAEATFLYWGEHNEPPGASAGFVAALPEGARHIFEHMERGQQTITTLDDDDKDDLWKAMETAIENYNAPDAEITKAVSKKKLAETLLREGKPREEILELTGLTKGRISQIAKEISKIDAP